MWTEGRVNGKDLRIAWDSDSNPIYIGETEENLETEGDDVWYIKKISWTGGNPVRVQGPLKGNWTDRSSLDWS